MAKAAVPLDERTVLAHALDAVTEELGFGVVVLVLPAGPEVFEHLSAAGSLLANRTGIEVVVTVGGGTRAASVDAGVRAVEEHASAQGWAPEQTAVLIHDAARALTPPEVYQRVAAAVEAGAPAAVPGLAVADTIKQVGPSEQLGAEPVRSTLARSELRAVQTPQGFAMPTLQAVRAHFAGLDETAAEAFTDEAMAAEHLGHLVVVVPGHQHALKITTPTDLVTVRGLLRAYGTADAPGAKAAAMRPNAGRDIGAPTGPGLPRVGIGHDIHAFAPETEPCRLRLGGLDWPGEQGLAGHSDGDAAAHAACAALFSAAGLGDLGTHFGADTIGTARQEIAGASGARLLEEAGRTVREAGFEIGNVAVQIVASRPKFAPRREESEAALTRAAGAPVSVSATTSDGLGFTGRGEGIMATATALVYTIS